MWYMRRPHAPSGHAFGPLGDNDDEEVEPWQPQRTQQLLTIEESAHSRGPTDATAEATQSQRKPSTGGNRARWHTHKEPIAVS